LYHRLTERLETVPGVRSASISMCGLDTDCGDFADGIEITGMKLPSFPSPSLVCSNTSEEVSMGPTILALVILALIGIGVVLSSVTRYNSLVQLKNDIDKAWANIDVMLKQRHDELPKLIETCKGYMQYEQKTFQMVAEARNVYRKATTVPDKAQADNMVTGALKTLFAVAENYPDLKANSNFLQLQSRITDFEEKIADRREFYNDSVNTYNIRIQQLPDVLIARLMSFQPHELFKITEEDRRDVEVKLT
jgi:LemA protein